MAKAIKKILKVGVIGLGVGEQHISGYQRHPACEVAALCDLSGEKLDKMRKDYPGCYFTKRADDILDNPEIDIVSIASYDNYHYEQIIKAINNDKHVFVEKPLCLYEKEARHIRSLLKAKPKIKLSSNLILRMSPRFRQLRQMIKKGRLGSLFYLEGDYNYGRLDKITGGWRGKIDFYSVVYGGGIHIIDLLLWLTGDLIVEVKAYGNHIASGGKFRYNDMAVCILKFKSGIIGKIAVNFGCVFPHFHALSIYGTKATFINGPKNGFLFKSRDPNREPQKIRTLYPGIHKGGLIYGFIDSILDGRPAEVTEENVFRAMSVSFAVEKAVRQSGCVRVKYI